MIKLIASDLDGTLLKEGTMDINPEIYDIIRKLKAKGIVFAAVSGREYDSIERVFAPVKDDIYFIAGNGGIISYQGEIIEKMAIPADVLKEVVEYVRAQEGASFMTAGSAQAYVERADQAFVKKLREGYKLHVNEVDDVLNAPETMTKVAMYNEKIDAAVGAEEAKKRCICAMQRFFFAYFSSAGARYRASPDLRAPSRGSAPRRWRCWWPWGCCAHRTGAAGSSRSARWALH